MRATRACTAQVAIKILPPGSVADPQFRERFDREARAVAALSHPNIVAIYDVGTHDGAPYAAIELLEGETLAVAHRHVAAAAADCPRLRRADRPRARGGARARDRPSRSEARQHLRDAGQSDQDPRLRAGDAGASQTSDETTRLAQTERGTVLGTVGYMSPEQARGERADERSDIFSFGCVLYEMVSARRAFTGDSRIETLHAILKESPPDLAASGRGIPLPARCA